MKKRIFTILILILMGMLYTGCTTGTAATAAPEEPVRHNITKNAELKNLSMTINTIRKESKVKMVVFDLTLKNTSSKPLRYSVMVYIPGVGSGADFIPAAGEEFIKPGEELKGSVGVLTDSDFFPTNFMLEIMEE